MAQIPEEPDLGCLETDVMWVHSFGLPQGTSGSLLFRNTTWTFPSSMFSLLEIMQGKSPYLLSTTSYLILQQPGSSVVEHLVYVQEVLGSNPSQATSFQGHTILNIASLCASLSAANERREGDSEYLNI
jgi:hypothetical protein